MPSLATRTMPKRARKGASRMALVQLLGSPRAGPAMPPQIFGAASSMRPSRSRNGPHEETPTAFTCASGSWARRQLSPIMRSSCWPSASLVPSLAVGSTTRPCIPEASAILTATLVPPTSTQAFRPFRSANRVGLNMPLFSCWVRVITALLQVCQRCHPVHQAFAARLQAPGVAGQNGRRSPHAGS